jgi:hypothetical protein
MGPSKIKTFVGLTCFSVLVLPTLGCSGSDVARSPVVPVETESLAILGFTVNGETGDGFRISSNDEAVVTVNIYDKLGQLGVKQDIDKSTLALLQIRRLDSPQPVAGFTLETRPDSMISVQERTRDTHYFQAIFNPGGVSPIEPGDYTLAVVVLERLEAEPDSELPSPYIHKDLLTTSLTIMKAGDQ